MSRECLQTPTTGYSTAALVSIPMTAFLNVIVNSRAEPSIKIKLGGAFAEAKTQPSGMLQRTALKPSAVLWYTYDCRPYKCKHWQRLPPPPP